MTEPAPAAEPKDPPAQGLPGQPGPIEAEAGPPPEATVPEPEAAPEPEVPPAASSPAAPAGSTAGRQSRSAGVKWLIGGAIGLVVLAAVAAAAVAVFAIVGQLQGDAGRAEVGDCLDGAGDPNQVRRVECGSPEAAWVVVHRATGVTESEFTDPRVRERLCEPGGEWESAFWIGEDTSSPGDLLCLAAQGQPAPSGG